MMKFTVIYSELLRFYVTPFIYIKILLNFADLMIIKDGRNDLYPGDLC